MGGGERIGILLANTGTPSAPTPQALRLYLSEFLSNPHIVPMNKIVWSIILHAFILPRRSRTSAAKYASISTDEGSPLLVVHRQLADKLVQAYAESDCCVELTCGMSFGAPSLHDALTILKTRGCTRIVCLPLYPQSAYATTTVVREGVHSACERLNWDIPVEMIEHYGTNEAYVHAITSFIRDAGFDTAHTSGDRLLFSFHSVPLVDIEAGDTYHHQTIESCQAIAADLGISEDRWILAYQSRFDKARNWLTPTSKDAVLSVAQTNAKRLFVICPGFSVDCLETILDIDQHLKQYYYDCIDRKEGTTSHKQFIYIPCLNATDAQVSVLRSVLAPFVEGER